MSAVRVALLNDYEIVVSGLVSLLEPFDEVQVVDVSVGNVSIDRPVDVALYDTYGRRGIPWEEINELVAEPRARHVAIFTFASTSELALDAVRHGVDGFLWKGLAPHELVKALVRIADGERVVELGSEGRRAVAAGQRWPFDELGLTARESEVLALVADGLPNKEIAAALYIAPETTKTHLRNIFRKLGVRSRSEAALMAVRDASFARTRWSGTEQVWHPR